MVSRYKADGLCPSILDTVPKPAGTIVHVFTHSTLCPALHAQSWGPQEWGNGELGKEGERDNFDLGLNLDLVNSCL